MPLLVAWLEVVQAVAAEEAARGIVLTTVTVVAVTVQTAAMVAVVAVAVAQVKEQLVARQGMQQTLLVVHRLQLPLRRAMRRQRPAWRLRLRSSGCAGRFLGLVVVWPWGW
jgi:hypothetical protein